MLDADFRSKPAAEPGTVNHETFYLNLLKIGIENATAISHTEERMRTNSCPLAKDERAKEALTAKVASTAGVVNNHDTEPIIVYSHHSYTELAASSSEHIFFDNCANTCTIIDRTLITSSAEREGPKMRISGSVPGSLVVNDYGILANFGVKPIDARFTKNILCEVMALRAGWTVEKEGTDSSRLGLPC
jgi:hypothetical protein